jgi:ribosomal protein S18 acetylase RimI-like enzyme
MATNRLVLIFVRNKNFYERKVCVVEGNNIALRLYEKMGFKRIGKDKYEHIALSQTI